MGKDFLIYSVKNVMRYKVKKNMFHDLKLCNGKMNRKKKLICIFQYKTFSSGMEEIS